LPRPALPCAGWERGMAVRLFKCDHCGRTEPAEDGENFVQDWEDVTVSTSFHYDICDDCSPALFKFLDGPSTDQAQKRSSSGLTNTDPEEKIGSQKGN